MIFFGWKWIKFYPFQYSNIWPMDTRKIQRSWTLLSYLIFALHTCTHTHDSSKFDPCTIFDLIYLSVYLSITFKSRFFLRCCCAQMHEKYEIFHWIHTKIALNFDIVTISIFLFSYFNAWCIQRLSKWVSMKEMDRGRMEYTKKIAAVEMEKNRIAIKQIRHDCTLQMYSTFFLSAFSIFSSFLHFYEKKNIP